MHIKTERGIVVGNTYDKYSTRNPVARRLMRGFLRAFDDMLDEIGVHEAMEVGCGEGHLALRMARRGVAVRACDISVAMTDVARARAATEALPARFEALSIYDLTINHSAQLVVCCEVLEHLDDPIRALDKVLSIARPYVILSVPREPIWRLMNLMRLSYLRALGNTPGHVQHWTRSSFIKLIAERADIVRVRSPFPWTMVLARKSS